MDSRRLKRLYIDMDGVLCDFKSEYDLQLKLNPQQPYPQSQYGFFLNLKPIENAIESVKYLENYYDTWILTRPSVHNIMCYSEKAQWIKTHLGFDMQVKTIICTDKSLLRGDYLVDDQLEHGQKLFCGKLIHFGSEEFKDWNVIKEFLLKEKEIKKPERHFYGC